MIQMVYYECSLNSSCKTAIQLCMAHKFIHYVGYCNIIQVVYTPETRIGQFSSGAMCYMLVPYFDLEEQENKQLVY